MEKVGKILDDFKDRIVAITHKDIPKYDWQEAGYSNAKWIAEKEILSLVPEEKKLILCLHDEICECEDCVLQNKSIKTYNACIAEIKKRMEG